MPADNMASIVRSELASPASNPTLEMAIDFLRSIGLEVELVDELPAHGFLPGIAISRGTLRVCRTCSASNLLHEAGHLATVPTRYRPLLDGNVSKGITAMFKDIQKLDLDPDHPLMRAALQASDPEATAWAWAAGLAAGLPLEAIILDSEYDGTGDVIRSMLRANQYAGIHGLMHAGMCKGARHPGGYPAMIRWLQDVPVPHEVAGV